MDIERIEKIVDNVNSKFAIPAKPATFGKEYTFPSDFSKLDSNDLANWLSRLAEWEGYSMRLLSEAEVVLNILEESFECIIAKQSTLEIDANKKVTKDYILGKVLQDASNSELRSKITSKRAECMILKRLVELYNLQFTSVSREISRRSMEIKSLQKGLTTNDY